jgi:purine-binding chemotaxis protein CheW
VTIREERYALPLPSLVNVHERIVIIPVPCVPRHVAGIANIRGHIIPVLDLGVLMDVPGVSTAKNSTLVVAAHHDLKVAFLVERIGDVATYTVNSVAPVPMNLETRQAVAYVQGILPGGAALLNIDAILDDDEITVNEKVN